MPRGRPKKTDEVLILEVRITPPDEQPITDWKQSTHFEQLIMFQEGGTDQPKKLHYHGYLKTIKSKSWILDWIYSITNAKQHGKDGNAVYFTKQPHDHTFGYIAKHGCCVIREGVPQTTIDEWLQQSDDYRKQKETTCKRSTRTRDDELKQVYEELEASLMNLKLTSERYLQTLPQDMVDKFLDLCHKYGYRFPTRSQLDYYVLKLIYPYNPYAVRSYYGKSFEVRNI